MQLSGNLEDCFNRAHSLCKGGSWASYWSSDLPKVTEIVPGRASAHSSFIVLSPIPHGLLWFSQDHRLNRFLKWLFILEMTLTAWLASLIVPVFLIGFLFQPKSKKKAKTVFFPICDFILQNSFCLHESISIYTSLVEPHNKLCINLTIKLNYISNDVAQAYIFLLLLCVSQLLFVWPNRRSQPSKMLQHYLHTCLSRIK